MSVLSETSSPGYDEHGEVKLVLPEELLDLTRQSARALFRRAHSWFGNETPSCASFSRRALRKAFVDELALQMQEINSRHSTWRKLMPVELWVIAWGYLPQCDRIRASHVCTAWRTLMLSTPRLWTHLHLKFISLVQAVEDQTPFTNESAILPLLQRSKDLPISFTVEILESGAPGQQEEYLYIAGSFLKLIVHRVQHLRIICDKSRNVTEILAELGEDAEQLQTLVCKRVEPREWIHDGWDMPWYTDKRNDLAAAPFYNAWGAFPCTQLRNLEFSPPTAFFWWPSTTLGATLQQLTSLEITAYTMDDIRRAVQACPNLDKLTLHTRELPYDRDISPEYSDETDWYSGPRGHLQTIVAHAPHPFCLNLLAESTRRTVELCYLNHHEESGEDFDECLGPFGGLSVLERLNTDGPRAVHIELDDQTLIFRLQDSTAGRERILRMSLVEKSRSEGLDVEGLVHNLRRIVMEQTAVHQLEVALALSSCPDMVCAVLDGLFIRQKQLADVRRCKLAVPPGFAWIVPFRKFRWLKSLPVAEELIFDDGTHVHSFDGASSFVDFMASHGVEQPATPERKTVLELKDWWTMLGWEVHPLDQS